MVKHQKEKQKKEDILEKERAFDIALNDTVYNLSLSWVTKWAYTVIVLSNYNVFVCIYRWLHSSDEWPWETIFYKVYKDDMPRRLVDKVYADTRHLVK